MSLTWDLRTVLTSTLDDPSSSATPAATSSSNPRKDCDRLTPFVIWNYLLRLSKPRDRGAKSSESDSLPLKYFRAEELQRDWDFAAQHLGEGASYNVNKHTLVQKDPRSGKHLVVAVKRLNGLRPGDEKGSPAASERLVATVLKELRILTRPPLREHDNIVPLAGFLSEVTPGSSGVEIALVTLFAEHGTLRDFLQAHKPSLGAQALESASQQQLTLLDRTQLVRDVCLGLEALHACGIAHGDLKLENVLVFSSEGQPNVRISDFGHSLVDLDTPSGAAGPYLGTPLYNAPEVRRWTGSGEPAIQGADAFYRCDIFSLGLLVWEAVVLSGRRYYDALGEDTSEARSQAEALEVLESLAKDELLLKAIMSLQVEVKTSTEEPGWLVHMLSQILQALLRDDPSQRKTAKDIVTTFRRQGAFNEISKLGEVFMHKTPPMSPLAPFIPEDNIYLQNSLSSDLPQSIQEDLVAQLVNATARENESSTERRRLALYNLALCRLSGFGSDRVDVDDALALLCEASWFGSGMALSLVFRLHPALARQYPQSAWQLKHPIVDLEKSLKDVGSSTYFVRRLRGLERIYQDEVLRTPFDIVLDGTVILTNITLNEVENQLQSSRISDRRHLLECISHPLAADEPVAQGYLLAIAARLGLKSLVELLIQDTTLPQLRFVHKKIDLLITACRGGHLSVLKCFTSRGIEPKPSSLTGTPLHYLNFFTADDASDALELLTSTRKGKECLTITSTIDDPTSTSHFRAVGTPLEIAIAANNLALVEHILAAEGFEYDAAQTHVGWTTNTFPLALALNLVDLLEHLMPYEIAYRSSAGARRENAKTSKAGVPPLGLFELIHPFDPLLPLLIHGPSVRSALESTVDWSINLQLCLLTDEDRLGRTALSHVVGWGACSFNTDAISVLLSRGAKFGKDESPARIVERIGKRKDHAAGAILLLLLEKDMLPLTSEIFEVAVASCHIELVQVLLYFDRNGSKIDVNAPFQLEINGESHTTGILSLAIVTECADMVRLLLDRGADIQGKRDGLRPLSVAISVRQCHGETIDVLIERGADLIFPEGHTILHVASSIDSSVNGLHVLFHLLRHESVRALIDTARVLDTEYGTALPVTPLYTAIMSGNPGAVHALLQNGARVDVGPNGVARLLKIATNVGRRPQLTNTWKGDPADEEALYKWRLDMEDITLAILSKGDPGHGRTRLHVAAGLGSMRRVIELVEKGGYRVTVGDKDRRLPQAFLDMDALDQQDGEEKEDSDWERAYVKNVKDIYQYLLRKTAEGTAPASRHDSDALERYLRNHPPSIDDSDQNKAITAQVEADLARLRLERDEVDASVGEGLDSPAEREVKVRKVFEKYRGTLGEDHPKTLRAMAALSELLTHMGRVQEADEMQLECFTRLVSTVEADNPLMFEAMIDRICNLCAKNEFSEAREYAKSVVDQALKVLGEDHPLLLEARSKYAFTLTTTGDVDHAIEIQEATLAAYQRRDSEDGISVSHDRVLLGHLNLMVALLADYCKVGRLDDAIAHAKPELYRAMLEDAGPASFFQAFDLVVNDGARGLDMYGLYEEAEAIYKLAIEKCVKRHGQRKSYCTKLALQRLAEHYRARGRRGEEAKTLQRLVDIIKATEGTDGAEYLSHMQDLARANIKSQRWVEATLVGEQLLHALEAAGSPNQRAIAQVRMSLCESLRCQMELKASEAHGRAAAADSHKHFGDEDEVTLAAKGELALTLMFSEKASEAIDILQGRVDIIVKVHGEIHHKTRQAVETLCTALMRARRMQEAEDQGVRLLAIARKIPETSGAVVSLALHTMAVVKELSEKFVAAKRLYAESIEEEKAFHGGIHSISSLSSMRSLAKLHIETGDNEAAEKLLLEIIADAPEDYEAAQPEAMLCVHQYLGRIYEDIPASLTATDTAGFSPRLDESITHSEHAIRIARSLYGNADARTIDCRMNLAAIMADAGRFKEALPLSEEILQHRRDNLGEHDAMTFEAKKRLCIVYPGMGMWEEAYCVQQDVLGFLRGSNDDPGSKARRAENWQEIYAVTDGLARSCDKLGRSASAVMYRREVVDILTEHKGEEDEDTLRASVDLAFSLIDRKKLDEAEDLVMKLSKMCERVFAADDDDMRKYMAEPVKATLYYQQNRLEEAMVVQRGILGREPDAFDKLRFYMDILVKMGKYSEALETAEVLSLLMEAAREDADPAGGDAGSDEAADLIELYVGMTEIYLKLNMPSDAERVGRRAVETIEGWSEESVPVMHLELYVFALETLEAVYESRANAQNEDEDLKAVQAKVSRSSAKA